LPNLEDKMTTAPSIEFRQAIVERFLRYVFLEMNASNLERKIGAQFGRDLKYSYEKALSEVGGKRRKTRKVRKSKRRQTKLRIKKRLTMS
jgi:hypothetical protein